jgi:hypothetical protein
LADIADVVGSVDDASREHLGARKKHDLWLCGCGRDRAAQARQQR